MNHYACSNSQSGLRFTTAFFSEFDPESHSLTYINAGHNAPILRRNSGVIEHLTVGGLPLGIRGEGSYESGEVALRTGDWLLTFTDGLVEAQNARNQEYSEQRLVQLLPRSTNITPEELLRRAMADVDAFVGETPQHDDITCMFVKVTG